MSEPKLLTVAEAAEKLGKTEKAVRRMLDRKTLADGGVVKNGRRMIPASALPMTEDEEAERLERISDEIGIPVEQLNQWLGDREELGIERGRRQIESAARGEVAELNNEIAEQRVQVKGLEQERNAAQEAKQETERLLSRIEDQVEDLLGKLDQERSRSTELEEQVETLRAEIETLKASAAEQVEGLRADLAAATQRAILAESHLSKRQRKRLDLTPETED